MRTFSARSRRNLMGVHPDLVLVVSRCLLYSPWDFVVNEGLRTLDRQRELKANGSSRTLNSKHLVQPDGYGHAIDLVAVGDLDGDGDVDAQDKKKTWDEQKYREIAHAMKAAADQLGIDIRWGGDFKMRDGKPWFDGPHFELAE